MIEKPEKIQHPKKRAFLAAYAEMGVVTRSAKIAQINRCTHNAWLNEEGESGDEYRAAFEDAKRDANDALESEARRRAIGGVDKPFYYQGELVETTKQYSDVLLIFLMKAADPGRFRDNFHQQEIPDENDRPGIDHTQLLRDFRQELQHNGGFIDYLRDRACRANGNPGTVGGNGHANLEDGPPPGGDRPIANGNGNGHVEG